MFKPGHVYTHRNLLDTKIYVKAVIPETSLEWGKDAPHTMSTKETGDLALEVTWFTKNGTAIAPDTITVNKEHFEDWSELC